MEAMRLNCIRIDGREKDHKRIIINRLPPPILRLTHQALVFIMPDLAIDCLGALTLSSSSASENVGRRYV